MNDFYFRRFFEKRRVAALLSLSEYQLHVVAVVCLLTVRASNISRNRYSAAERKKGIRSLHRR